MADARTESEKSNRNHALGSGQWLTLVLIATSAIFLGAYSIASPESPTEFWNVSTVEIRGGALPLKSQRRVSP